MPLAPGVRFGPYEVLAPIGSGGMGDVYRARDTRLGRDVAIKVLPEAFAGDPERLARFQREAQLLASLNHPNIAIIHGLEESNGIRALVMELVDGPTLADRIARGSLPVDETLAITRQIAEALKAAHDQGIIHRDLKPANIKVRGDGLVKVLDFGLAKLVEPPDVGRVLVSGPAGASPIAGPKEQDPAYVHSQSPTLSVAATRAGVILGTAAYMAPEQAKGKAVDKRADIWAFGCVLFEMLAGKRAFDGADATEMIAAVVRADPDWSALPASTAAALRTLLRQCLEKDRTRRLADIADARFELEEAQRPSMRELDPVPGASRRRERLAWASGLALVALVAAGALVWAFRPAPPAPEMRVEINTPPTNDPISFAISPDGRRIVFAASGDGQPLLWLRSLDGVTAQALPGTEGAQYPFWSPDSRSVAFFANGALKRLDIGGGSPQTLATAPGGPHGGTWSENGVVLFTPRTNGVVSRTSATGGEAVAVTTRAAGQSGHWFPQFLPGGRQFLFYAVGTQDSAGIYLGSLDSPEITRVTSSDAVGLYLPPGWLLFVRQETLVARRFDAARGEVTGDPVTVADDIRVDANNFVGAFSVSTARSVTYRASGASPRQLTWFDRSGKALGTVGAPDESLDEPALAPDGRRVAIRRTVQRNSDVWLLDAARTTRFTFDANVDQFPLWSPDGGRIVFSRNQGALDLYHKPSSGAGSEELLLKSSENKGASDWSPDGRFLLYGSVDPKTATDTWVLPMEGDRKPSVFLNSAFNERLGQFSPDGRWVAYQSDESGRYEIYVRPFPGPGGQWQMSTAGGISPRWRADGKELYYIAPDGTLMAASIEASGATLEPGDPTALFLTRIVSGGTSPVGARWQYDVAPDGRFLINVNTEDTTISPITLILNWNPER